MRLPTDRQIIDTARTIDEYAVLEKAQALRVFAKRAAKGSPQADGYRATTGSAGGSGGGPSVIVDDERVPVTGVELAAINRTGPPRRDLLAEAVNRAWSHLHAALTALDNFTVAVGNIANVQADPVDNDAKCWAMARDGVTEKAERRVTVDGDVRQVGRWAFDFHKVHGRLPTIDECMVRRSGKTVSKTRRIDPKTGAELPADQRYIEEVS